MSPDVSLQEATLDEREVCHSALWLPGSDVFLYVPYSVFIVVAVRRPSAVAIAAGELVEVNLLVLHICAGCDFIFLTVRAAAGACGA
jgi:cytidine deaminase